MSDFNTTISFDVFNVSLSFVDEGTFIVVKQYVDEQLDSKQDTLIAGENITIVGNVISSTYVSIEHDDTLNKNINPDFLHINEEEKNLITSTADIVSGHTGDIESLEEKKADKETTYTKSEVEQIKIELLNLIYAGL